jgi:hypothetical protein
MMGGSSPAAENLERRAAATRYVLSGRVVAHQTGAALALSIGPRDAGADLASMFSSSVLAKREAKVAGKTLGLLAQVPVLARAVVDAALAPPLGADATATTTPPAPLAPPASTNAPSPRKGP